MFEAADPARHGVNVRATVRGESRAVTDLGRVIRVPVKLPELQTRPTESAIVRGSFTEFVEPTPTSG